MSIPSVPISIIAPTQLETIELSAGNIMDSIDMQDWDKVKPILQANSISQSLIYRLDSAINKLDEEIASKKVYESKVQANLIKRKRQMIIF